MVSAMAKYEAFRKGPYGYKQVSTNMFHLVEMVDGELAFVPAFNMDPIHKTTVISSFFHIGQFRGSFGSSLG